MNLQSQPINNKLPKVKNGFSKLLTNNNIKPPKHRNLPQLITSQNQTRIKKKMHILCQICTNSWNLRDL